MSMRQPTHSSIDNGPLKCGGVFLMSMRQPTHLSIDNGLLKCGGLFLDRPRVISPVSPVTHSQTF